MDMERLKTQFQILQPHLNERTRRLVAATFALTDGDRSISAVSEATGVSRRAIALGISDLQTPPDKEHGQKERIRKEGGGRKTVVSKDLTLIPDLEAILEPTKRGDPETMLLWTCKSLRAVVAILKSQSHEINHQTLADLLRGMGYRLQANFKAIEKNQSPDRNEQFELIHQAAKEFARASQPVISVDTKKKELVGNFKNNGRNWLPQGSPERVNVHDFEDEELGKAVPFGVYDVRENTGWVNVGLDNDTSAFAVASIRGWWDRMGKNVYPTAERLMITADGGGSNGYRRRLWKTELQSFADDTGLHIHVHHLPPGTSKWNKIEHCLFSFISMNWRGKPLVSYEVIVSLIGATTTSKGLKVHCQLDERKYDKGIKISKEEMDSLNIERNDFHGEWNYTIRPRATL